MAKWTKQMREAQAERMKKRHAAKKAAIVPATGNIVRYDIGPAAGGSGGSATHTDAVVKEPPGGGGNPQIVWHDPVLAVSHRIDLLDKVRALVEANVISHGEAWSITERIFQ